MLSIVRLSEVASTNSYIKEQLHNATHGTVVVTDCQTAGRGQRGNRWEAEPGKNLTFSIMLQPAIAANCQFSVSEAVSVAIVNVLRRHLPRPEVVTVKWPNDIYVSDSKICGILIENSLTGSVVSRSVAGIGVNVNQRLFLSDAPNPVSMANIAGVDFPLESLLEEFCTEILGMFPLDTDRCALLHADYLSMLWRADGFYPYMEPGGNPFMARIVDIAPTGILSLQREDSTVSRYAFKEVAAII